MRNRRLNANPGDPSLEVVAASVAFAHAIHSARELLRSEAVLPRLTYHRGTG
jgi:hypothetical protein